MKNAIRLFYLLPLLLFPVLPASAQLDRLRINEVDYQNGWIEFFYPTLASGSIDATAACICSRPKYSNIGGADAAVLVGNTTMNPGDFLVVAWDNANSNFNTSEGEVGLYDSCAINFDDETRMIDYMEYGASHDGFDGREDVAERIGEWNDQEFVPLAPAGRTLSFFGGGAGASNWSDGNPTQGMANSQLPVELIRFEARTDGQAILLTWETASETNNAGFEVQRRVGDAFEPITFFEGAGTTSQTRVYRHRVADLLPGRHTFRLKQVDFDGSFVLSPEVEVFTDVPGAYVLSPPYPNPFNPQTRFTLTVARSQHVRVGVYDMLGRTVALLHDGPLAAREAHTFRFDATTLPGGVYFLRAAGPLFSAGRSVTLLN